MYLHIQNMESEPKKSAYKVEDKRQFNSDGSDRHNSDASTAAKSGGQQDGTLSTDHLEHYSQASSQDEVSLSSFIMSLATQGMMQLGEMSAPEGFQVPVDLEHAKQTIDLISMLKEKTKGNQDEFEVKLFEEVLFSLRMAFVKKKGSA